MINQLKYVNILLVHYKYMYNQRVYIIFIDNIEFITLQNAEYVRYVHLSSRCILYFKFFFFLRIPFSCDGKLMYYVTFFILNDYSDYRVCFRW